MSNNYRTIRTTRFISDFKKLRKYDIEQAKKVSELLKELVEYPEEGSGKPERLRHNLSGLWSRRIIGKHRLIYKIDDANHTVILYSCIGHYGQH